MSADKPTTDENMVSGLTPFLIAVDENLSKQA